MALVVDEPFALLKLWLEEAQASEINDANAMALATVGPDGMPSLRMVLLKSCEPDGLVFYTNLGSQKAQQLQAHPKAAVLFHWKSLRRQVRVEGEVSSVSAEEADAYFASRPRHSQLGAWASKQSQTLEGRWVLEQRLAAVTARFGLGKVERPPFWSGFKLQPSAFEFWQDGAFRLHERLRLERESDGSWSRRGLYP